MNDSTPSSTTKTHKKTYSNGGAYLWGEWIRPIGEAVIIALIVTTFLFTTVGISGTSDTPTVLNGERVFVPKYETWLHRLGIGSFQRGDLVVLKPPVGAPQSERQVPLLGNFFPNLTYRPYFIKRIVGLPGDRIRLDRGQLYINGLKINETHTVPYWQAQKDYAGQSAWDRDSSLANTKTWPTDGWTKELQPTTPNPTDYKVPAGHYFVMGDNRSIGGSEDSRVFGPVSIAEFSGRATFVWWPPVSKGDDGKVRFRMRTLPRPTAFDTLK